jgi:hypothetical protein
MTTEQIKIAAPFDSGDYPKSVLIQGDDIADTECGQCLRPCDEWPRVSYGWGVPAAMYAADLYCASCLPYSYDESTGCLLDTRTGYEVIARNR